MLGELILLGAFCIAGGTLAYVFAANRRAREELKRKFRYALEQALRTSEMEQFRFEDFVRQAGVSVQMAYEVAEEIYARVYARALEDEKITTNERKKLDRFAEALALSSWRRERVESQLGQEAYHRALVSSLADSRLTEIEIQELEALRRRLGLTAEQVKAGSGTEGADVFRARLRQIVKKGPITQAEMHELTALRNAVGLSECDAEALVREDASALYRERFFEIRQDGRITCEEENELDNLERFLAIPEHDALLVRREIERIRRFQSYRDGKLPRVATKTILEGGEIAHWDGGCTFGWRTPTQARQVVGHLTVTSNRVIFSSDLRGFGFKPSRIADIEEYGDGVNIQTTSSRGTGAYLVDDPECLEAVLYGVVRRHKFLEAENFSSSSSRHIADDVKRDVWARDGGRCVRCNATEYLEFDHIIPHAKGGSNGAKNIQLLCRRCNLLKGDRI